jgi:hypothetical protein
LRIEDSSHDISCRVINNHQIPLAGVYRGDA